MLIETLVALGLRSRAAGRRSCRLLPVRAHPSPVERRLSRPPICMQRHLWPIDTRQSPLEATPLATSPQSARSRSIGAEIQRRDIARPREMR